MAATVLGNQGAALIPIRTRTRRTPQGVVVEETYRCDKDNAEALIGGYEYGDLHGTHTGSALNGIDHDKGQKFSEVTLIYEPVGWVPGENVKPSGTVERSGASNVSEFPIETHADWAESWKDTKRGQTGFFRGQPVYRRTEYLDADSWDWTEANVISGVNTIGAPTGLTDATAANWLKIVRDPQEQGDTVVLYEEWIYNADGWDTDIY